MPILENSSSPPASSPLPSSQVNADASPPGDEVSLKNYKPSSADMAYYYEHFLPFKSIYLWLNHSQAAQADFTMREFAFEYKSGAYQRYNSFHSATEFKQSVVKAQPTRFEVGAVYPVEPRMRKSVSKALMKPIAKELVLDIDLTDYDDVRTCCSGTEICPKCWRFITLAVKIVHRALQEDFGFEHLVWVFSGRRGVHCWVSDYRARILDETRRRAIVEYLDVLSVKSKKTLNLKKPYHPHVERAFEVLRDEFVEVILKQQDPWSLPDRAEALARTVPDYKLSSALIRHWKEVPGRTSAEKWLDVDAFYQQLKVRSFDLQDWKKETIFATMYPRLDVEVSRQMNHLLKSPFCVHPGTGNVCVPFDPSEKDFDPFADTPNLGVLVGSGETEWQKTGLRHSVELFNRFVNRLVSEEVRHKRGRAEDKENLEF
ncbi:hypothetical protein KL918_002613 [Ogataea parapolymorpha]|uniref:DNA primase n=1 Tax=Ogataea parapolymorpha (strain ATCC 26012 / BCRC 20466 / JCM 22074 / NRRL Y-7560 / DL-1) TaxID=871575 RepID=W1QFV8_OGAPD|nr:DNA primase small subunit [Ogataea parapolymorpha DL-1]ESX00968.1 DNA primase small subunit [Ogataea parapolymorpha DL-1]KAG7867174.1 hypothetical protein KL918_002613 [Ogataea parapolymorpha]KAG7870874.1 hypothetical protein KL916_004605 [Ogataea parapolymorpha]